MSKADIADKAIRTIKALGYAYVIRSPEGDIISHGEIEPKKRKTRVVDPAHKGYTQWLRDQGLETLQAGGYLDIDPGDRNLDALRGIATGYASKTWGAGSYTSSVEGGKLTIVRLG